MKRHINNPYKMNWKMYSLIGGISLLVMVTAVIWNDITGSIISDIFKNLGFGCVASTVVASLVEFGNIKEKNERANSIYDAVYIDLKDEILWYLKTWARLCCTAYKDKDYYQEKHTWIEWYEITKNKFAECDSNRQMELIDLFSKELMTSIEGIEKIIKQIDGQHYILNINGLYDENIKVILTDYRFEFSAAKLILEKNHNTNDGLWRSLDAIKQDLIKYIDNWVDIRYYNYYRFNPHSFFDNKTDIVCAILESEQHNKAYS